MFEEGFVTSKDVRLHYLQWGGEGKSVVLLAGLGSTAHIFRSLAPRLAGDYRVVAITRRGHGQSDRPPSGYELEILIDDITHCLGALAIERPVLIGHSYAGVEMPRLAERSSARIAGIVYLDGLFPRDVPLPMMAEDPTWTAIPDKPDVIDLESVKAYMAYYRRHRPDLARIWCDAIESDVMAFLSLKADGTVVDHRDEDLLNSMYRNVWSELPDYSKAGVPALALVPDGEFHPSVPPDAGNEFKMAADRYWLAELRPWIRQRTEAFQREVPAAKIVTLGTPNHHLFIAREDETLAAIRSFIDDIL